jgi:DNA repair exonuclease SbcCD ATPase subunit
LQHFIDIFNLDQHSAIKDVLTQRLRTIKDNELKLSVLEQQRLELRRKLKEIRGTASDVEYKAAKSDYEDCSKRIDDLQSERYRIVTRQRDLSQLLEVEKTLDELRSSYQFKKPPEKMLRLFKKYRSDSLAWDRWRHRSSEAKKLVEKIDKQLAQLELPDVSLEKLQTRRKKCRQRLSELSETVDTLTSAKRKHTNTAKEIARLQEEFDALGIPVKKLQAVDYRSEIAVLNATIKLEHLLEHESSDTHACPTCLTKLDFDGIRKAVTGAKKKKAQLQALAEAAKLHAELEELKADQVEFDQDELDQAVAERDDLAAKAELYTEQHEVLSKHATLTAHRDEIEIPPKPDCDEPEYSVSEIDEHTDLCASIVDALSSKDVILSNHADLADLRSAAAVTKKLESLSKKLSSLDSDLATLREVQSKAAAIVTTYEQHKSTHRVYKRELDSVEVKIEKLKPSATTKKLLEILIKAYGPKGLRAVAADSICSLFQTNLNHYCDLIFAEPFVFEVRASESGISITVDRNNGKPDSVSDVRNLSGAESNSFQLLCLISLLPLLPDNERVNLVVLDGDVVALAQWHVLAVTGLEELGPWADDEETAGGALDIIHCYIFIMLRSIRAHLQPEYALCIAHLDVA